MKYLTIALLLFTQLPFVARAENPESKVVAETKETTTSKGDSDSEGEELWSANCGRCHNKISPDTFSDKNWATVMQHMRTRAYLTGEEVQKIVDFLRSANE